MTLRELIQELEPQGVKIAGRERSEYDGWLIYLGIPAEMIIPFAFAHCITIQVPDGEDPLLHPDQVAAVRRRFATNRRIGPKSVR